MKVDSIKNLYFPILLKIFQILAIEEKEQLSMQTDIVAWLLKKNLDTHIIKNYRNYNSQGGDCANFASQILFEGGRFRKTIHGAMIKTGATRSWLNADGFKDYMIYSGRASVVAHGSYEKRL